LESADNSGEHARALDRRLGKRCGGSWLSPLSSLRLNASAWLFPVLVPTMQLGRTIDAGASSRAQNYADRMREDDDHLKDDEHLTNPAGRLLLFFRHMRQHGAHSSQASPVSTKTLAASYLDVPESNVAEFYGAAAGLMQLPGEARRQLSALVRPSIPKSTLLAPYEIVENTLPGIFNTRSRAHDFNEPIDNGILVGLDMGSAMLFHHAGAKVLDEGALDQIRRRATEIIDELAHSDLPGDVREVLLVHAQRLIDAVNVYRVHGSDAVLRESDALTGALVRSIPRISDKRDNPLVRTILNLGAFVAAVTTILGTPAAIEGGVDFVNGVLDPPAVTVEAPGPIDDTEIVIEYGDELDNDSRP
jgi:hypothetical protein